MGAVQRDGNDLDLHVCDGLGGGDGASKNTTGAEKGGVSDSSTMRCR